MSDIVERLNDIWANDDHDRGCQGREYSCSCGFDNRTAKTAEDAASEIVRLRQLLSEAEKREAEARAKAVEDVLSALTAHELYQYRPKAFQGFIDYVRSTVANSEESPFKLACAAYDLAAWAGSINWRGGENQKEWLDELRQHIETVQSLCKPYRSAIRALQSEER